MTEAIDPSRCPLCGQPNRCAMEIERERGVPQGPCWCTQADFAGELLARVPEAARGNACICAACAAGLEANARQAPGCDLPDEPPRPRNGDAGRTIGSCASCSG